MIPDVYSHRKICCGSGILSEELTVYRVNVSLACIRLFFDGAYSCRQILHFAKDADIKWLGVLRGAYLIHPASQTTEMVVASIYVLREIT